ncbi:hypothetical protein [Bacillus massiliigorillae]|uniref:hypothetical protein n=1 Tax=Bacillus massiliigorillae TaxID=1243664 RepID=UPI0003A5EB5B|nr:hypothetical protein [Bacillus massiliigorillae]
MKGYAVFLIQWMVWSGFTLAEWLSGHDRIIYKAFMFLIFLQVAIYISQVVLHSKVKTSFITFLSLLTYGMIHFLLQQFVTFI